MQLTPQSRLRHDYSHLEELPDENQLQHILEAMTEEDTIRQLGKRYRPTYLNLFSQFHSDLPAGRLRQVAGHITKSAIWSHAAVERYLGSIPEQPLECRLGGWRKELIDDLLGQGRGLIICSYRFGLYGFLLLDLITLGYRVCCPLADVAQRSTLAALEGVRQRVGDSPHLTEAERSRLSSIFSSIRVIDVANRNTSLELARALRRGEIIVLFADGNNGVDGPWGEEGRVPVKFFGSSIMVKTGVAKLSLLRKTPILPAFTRKTNASSGTIDFASPIISPDRTSRAAECEPFVHSCMQSLYSLLEQYARAFPEQWEGVSALHRWRRPGTSDQQSGSSPYATAEDTQRALLTGSIFRINERDGVTAVPGEEEMWVDTRSMKGFSAPPWARPLLCQLAGDGIDQGWIQGQEDKSHEALLAMLRDLHNRGLITQIQ